MNPYCYEKDNLRNLIFSTNTSIISINVGRVDKFILSKIQSQLKNIQSFYR